MSLLKSLQNKYSNNQVPWVPLEYQDIRKFLNEIAMAEESDVFQLEESQETHSSHYDMYIQAMRDLGADIMKVQTLLMRMKNSPDPVDTINVSNLPQNVRQFLAYNFGLIQEGKMHKIGSAFTFGREDIIPDMFKIIVYGLQQNFPEAKLDSAVYYFNRHIQLDSQEHGPIALQLMGQLCQSDNFKWREAQEVAIESLQRRELLWDGIYQEIKSLNV